MVPSHQGSDRGSGIETSGKVRTHVPGGAANGPGGQIIVLSAFGTGMESAPAVDQELTPAARWSDVASRAIGGSSCDRGDLGSVIQTLLTRWSIADGFLGGVVDLLGREQHRSLQIDRPGRIDGQGMCRDGGVVGRVHDGHCITLTEAEIEGFHLAPNTLEKFLDNRSSAGPPSLRMPFAPSAV